jgi:hypothetical protein
MFNRNWGKISATRAGNRVMTAFVILALLVFGCSTHKAREESAPVVGPGLRVEATGTAGTGGGTGSGETNGVAGGIGIVPYTTNLVHAALGSFPSVEGVSGVTDDVYGQNSYSLQINSNAFSSANGACTLCGTNIACTCQQQFIFSNRPDAADGSKRSQLAVKYWLKGYGSPCPSNAWQSHGLDCSLSQAVSANYIDPTDLPRTRLYASTGSEGNVAAVLSGPVGEPSINVAPDLLGLSKTWHFVQFNIFGYSDSQLSFDSGAALVVRVEAPNYASDGSESVAPLDYTLTNFAASSTNLYSGNPCPSGARLATDAPHYPGLQFFESNPASTVVPFCLSKSLNRGVSWETLPRLPVPGAPLDIGVGNDTAWVIASDHTIFEWNPSLGNWVQSEGIASRIAVQADGVPWAVDAGGGIYRKSTNDTTGGWVTLPGCAADIGVGLDGSVWIINCAPVYGGWAIAKWNGTSFVQETSGNGGGTRIAVDSTGIPWVADSHGSLCRRSTTDPTVGEWERVGTSTEDIGIGPEGYPWIIGTRSMSGGYNIRAWDDVNGTLKDVQGIATHVSVGRNARPWVTDAKGGIYRAYN